MGWILQSVRSVCGSPSVGGSRRGRATLPGGRGGRVLQRRAL